ncbi:MAG: enoyl-CoA hydratase-related protein [Proteobacteria bacterium]|nr:enoyl-CoA hydratase-related protein [Pseudomonadota bacterium]MDA1058149.1 enoyl-CoA hydratase-related protein [Pseudomonadota bacterium]
MTSKTQSDSEILVDGPTDGVLTLTLNRPQVKNAFSNTLLELLRTLFRDAAHNDDVRCVMLTGGPEVFAAGSDISQLQTRPMYGGDADARFANWDEMERFPKPVVAAVNGYALGGGCELAMLADIIVAGDTAKFGLPELRLGLFPGLGGTQRFIRQVGKSVAMKVILAAEFIDAAEAHRLGLAAEVVPAAETIARATALATKIAAMPPLAARVAKETILQAYETHLGAGLAYERKSNLSLYPSADKAEGVAAFLEKRKPNWQGK